MRSRQALICLALALPPSHAPAAQDDVARLRAELTRLEQRIALLEAAVPAPEGEGRRAAQQEAVAARLADMEIELLSLRRQARAIEAIEGISAGAAMTMVAQNAVAGEMASAGGEFNYRGDISVTLPGGAVGNGSGHLFAHFRIGQGEGLALRHPGFSSTPNSTAFRLREGDDAAAILAQAWYQLDLPLAEPGAEAGRHLELNVGKLDPFVFFDQNAIADDESSHFLNNAFVHNPLLDSGGAAGVDAYGFSPGVRLAHHADGAAGIGWRVSLGAFGAGEGASFSDSFDRPFVIARFEAARHGSRGLPGNYRIYAWTNGRATPYANSTATASERQSGWGVSADQQVTETTTVFARYGHAPAGRVRFDRAFTAGIEVAGAAWGRAHDRLGLAGAWLSTSRSFEAAAAVLDADGADGPDFGYAPSGAEHLAELYYAWQVNDHLGVTPDVQWISRPGADGTAEDVALVGLRATLGF